jgi:drug/metabolite transporter (DMT)-like permease
MSGSVLLSFPMNQYRLPMQIPTQRLFCIGQTLGRLHLCWSLDRLMLHRMSAVVSEASAIEIAATEQMRRARSQLALFGALAAVYVIWGSTYLVMRWAVVELPPMLMGTFRFTLAGGVLYAIARARGAPAPTARQWGAAAIVGGLLFVGGNGLVAMAERTVDSGVAAVIVATMPLWLAVMVGAAGERVTRREWAGMAFGIAGVLVLVVEQIAVASPVDIAVLAVSPISWAAGSLLARRLALPAGAMSPAIQMIAGGVLMGAVGLARGESLDGVPSADALAALGYLIVFGSLIAFTAYAWLLRNTRPALATSYAFVNPPLAVAFGVVVGGEAAGWPLAVATPLVVFSVALVVLGRQKK